MLNFVFLHYKITVSNYVQGPYIPIYVDSLPPSTRFKLRAAFQEYISLITRSPTTFQLGSLISGHIKYVFSTMVSVSGSKTRDILLYTMLCIRRSVVTHLIQERPYFVLSKTPYREKLQ